MLVFQTTIALQLEEKKQKHTHMGEVYPLNTFKFSPLNIHQQRQNTKKKQ